MWGNLKLRRFLPTQSLQSLGRSWLIPTSAVLIIAAFGCSPGYVLRAGYEEARILWNREDIDKLLHDPNTPAELKQKLELVVAARKYSETIGLVPEESFTQYSDVGRDDLLWVVTAAEPTDFVPYTWWFPIVGRIPYKGFFDKAEAEEQIKKLNEKGYDTYMRPSSAFSTLGWFNDPLLSTTAKHEDGALVDTVIHELLHNTVWVKNNVPFNESLANYIGGQGARRFFEDRFGPNSKLATECRIRAERELQYAHFLWELIEELKALYREGKKVEGGPTKEHTEQLLAKRDELINTRITQFRERAYPGIPAPKETVKINNAVLLAQETYLKEPWLFDALLHKSGGELADFIQLVKKLVNEAKQEKVEPYEYIRRYLGKQADHTEQRDNTEQTEQDHGSNTVNN